MSTIAGLTVLLSFIIIVLPETTLSYSSWIPDLCLCKDDEEILKSERLLLNDAIVNASQRILSKSGIAGFQNTQLGKGFKFKAIENAKFVQILHVNMNHWITVSNINCPTNCVNIYDSLYNYITLQTKKQICSFIRSDQNILQFRMADVESQKDGISCGLYAIAFATELCDGGDPVSTFWDVSQFRSHLLQCLTTRKMTVFPKLKRRVTSAYVKRTINERIMCICRMPIDSKLLMFQCKICNELYHHDCCTE